MSKKFDRYKVNCSDLPELMSREQGNTPPTEKDLSDFLKILDKDLIEITDLQRVKLQSFVTKTVNYDNYSLSPTMRKAIYRHYSYSQFGVGKVSLGSTIPPQLEKGELAEPEAIKMLSELDGVPYTKNKKLYSSSFFKGVPDILLFENGKVVGVKDVKVSFDFPSFLERVDGDSVLADRWEMLAYMEILGLNEGEICYCLVDMPDSMKEAKLKEYRDRLVLLGISKDHMRSKIKQVERSMVYSFLPPEKRIRRFIVTRRNFFIKQASERVRLTRAHLMELHNKFENPVNLFENKEILPDDLS